MPHPPILILGYSETAMFLRQGPRAPLAAILSVRGSAEPPLECDDVPHKLTLNFDDVEQVDPKDPLSMYHTWVRLKWAAENGRAQTPPSVEDAQRIIEFAEAVREVEGVVLFQCQAGMSRSPAAALICLAAWTGPGNEVYCVEQVLRVRRGAVPHLGLVKFADELLNRGGRLLEAARTGRSADL